MFYVGLWKTFLHGVRTLQSKKRLVRSLYKLIWCPQLQIFESGTLCNKNEMFFIKGKIVFLLVISDIKGTHIMVKLSKFDFYRITPCMFSRSSFINHKRNHELAGLCEQRTKKCFNLLKMPFCRWNSALHIPAIFRDREVLVGFQRERPKGPSPYNPMEKQSLTCEPLKLSSSITEK